MHRRNIERNAARVAGCWRLKGPLAGLLVVGGVALSGCSDEGGGELPVPSPDVVRNAYGLGTNHCAVYQAGAVEATVTVEGPNDASIIGETVYRWSFRRQNGGLADEWFFDTEANGEVRLLRAVTGPGAADRATRNYPTDGVSAPLFYKLRFQGQEVVADQNLQTDVTPDCVGAGCPDPIPPERHAWIVQPDALMVTTPDTPAGEMESASLLIYQRTVGDVTETADFTLVPGKGFATITYFDNTIFQACNWLYCDDNGCPTEDQCRALQCD